MNNLHCGTIDISAINVDLQNSKTNTKSGVRVYIIFVPDYLNSLPSLLKNLSKEEKLRSGRYHFDADRNRFIISRSLLRLLLAEEAGLEAEKMQIERDSFDKPYLPSHPNLYFNVSHSGDYVLIIIGNKKVGIDVEKINYNQDFEDIYCHVFTEREILELSQSLDKTKTFYKFWTRKEAILKATGKGINEDLKLLSVINGNHALSSNVLGNIQNLVTLSFEMDSDHMGALAFEGNCDCSIAFIRFNKLPLS